MRNVEKQDNIRFPENQIRKNIKELVDCVKCGR
jgi:hypothetical protein